MPAVTVGLVLTLAACSGGRDEQEASPPPAPASAAPTSNPANEATTTADSAKEATSEAAEDSAPCDAEGAEWLDLAGDGSPDAYQLGSGDAAVILLHQNDGQPCKWVPFAEQLVDEGYAVLVPHMRPRLWPQPVISLAAEHLRAQGTERLALVGASMGGTYAIAGAPDLAQPPDVIVTVSAPDYYRGASARDVIGDLDVPLLLLVAEDDKAFVAEGEALREAAPASALVIRPGFAHGIQLIEDDPEAAQLVLDALAEHLRTD